MTTTTKPVLTFRSEITSAASPEAVYDALVDLRSHLRWAGQEAKHKSFKLLTIQAPSEPARVGTTFSSTGENGNGVFHDSSTVTEAEPGRRFAFDTSSELDRKHGKRWQVRFRHDYVLEPTPEGTRIRYSCEIRPQNYVPYWLKPGVKQLVKLSAGGWIRDNLRNLDRLAEEGARTG
jgi:uncharacterized protein YndB with AHSA1/START domain